VPQADYQAFALLGGGMHQACHSIFRGRGKVRELVFSEAEQVDQQKKQTKDAQSECDLVIETERGKHTFALAPSLNPSFLKCTAKRTSR